MLAKIKALYERYRPRSRAEIEHEYLCEATDLVDLERRMRNLQYRGNLF
jgi:hypothetical protein